MLILAHDKNALINHRKKLSESQQINNIRSEMNDLKNKVDLILLHLQDMRGLMPSVSVVELTNTFDDWRNRTNDVITEINGANSVDPCSAIVYANSYIRFSSK